MQDKKNEIVTYKHCVKKECVKIITSKMKWRIEMKNVSNRQQPDQGI